MKKENRQVTDIILRYLLILLSTFNGFFVFYFLMTPLTVIFSSLIIDLFYDAIISGNNLMVQGVSINIVDSCVAGAAYFLLFFLNMSIPNIKLSRRFEMILVSFSILLLANVLRIFFLTFWLVRGYANFELIHNFLWHFVSIAFVLIIWFGEVKFYKINKFPGYSDIKFIFSKSLLKKWL